jgi:hypothetical protein
MTRYASLCLALAMLGACNGSETATPGDDAAATGEAQGVVTPTPSPAVSPAASPTPAGARSVSEKTDDFVFEYSYPAEAGNLPELAALLDRRLDRARTLIAEQAAEGRSEARENGFPFNKYSSGMAWKVVADLPGWLSLSGELTSYTGGAHGIYGMQSLVWDKEGGEARRGMDLFTSPEALGEALGERYCEALDALRAERRPEELQDDTFFIDCPSMEELTVLVGSSNGRTFDRLTLYAGPYVAGPYAEGAYEVDLDVDAAVLEAVKPEFRESFGTRN